jgi:hypothetical protein
MRMNDRLAVFAQRQNPKVQLDLAARLTFPNGISMIVDHEEIGGPEVALADAAWSAEDLSRGKPDAQVPLASADEVPLPKPTADLTHLGSKLKFAHSNAEPSR